MADDTVVAHKQRAHFPFVNLSKALGRTQELYTADPAGRLMPVSSAFEVWQYSLKSSGGHQTIASLIAYGLLVDEGALGARKVGLSAQALRYFKDEREDQRLNLLQEFALKPKLFNRLWHMGWKASPPNDTIARSQLKVELGLGEQAARAVLGIYKDNMKLAKLTGEAKIPEVADEGDSGSGGSGGSVDYVPPPSPPAHVKVGDFVQWTSGGALQFQTPRRVDWVSEDRKYLRVFGSPTGIPMSEATVAEAPGKTPVIPLAGTNQGGAGTGTTKSDDISVYLVRDRLQITADVDAAGLTKLKEILDKYTEILELMS